MPFGFRSGQGSPHTARDGEADPALSDPSGAILAPPKFRSTICSSAGLMAGECTVANDGPLLAAPRERRRLAGPSSHQPGDRDQRTVDGSGGVRAEEADYGGEVIRRHPFREIRLRHRLAVLFRVDC